MQLGAFSGAQGRGAASSPIRVRGSRAESSRSSHLDEPFAHSDTLHSKCSIRSWYVWLLTSAKNLPVHAHQTRQPRTGFTAATLRNPGTRTLPTGSSLTT